MFVLLRWNRSQISFIVMCFWWFYDLRRRAMDDSVIWFTFLTDVGDQGHSFAAAPLLTWRQESPQFSNCSEMCHQFLCYCHYYLLFRDCAFCCRRLQHAGPVTLMEHFVNDTGTRHDCIYRPQGEKKKKEAAKFNVVSWMHIQLISC